MAEQNYSDFWDFIKLLSDNGLLSDIVVIGSWAEYIYAQSGLLPGFSASLRTLDMDFLVKNLRLPNPPQNVPALAREAGYTVDSDRLDGTTKIYTPGLMEIEFLISQMGSGVVPVMQTNLGVRAQALRNLEIIRNHIITVQALGFEIQVPAPEAYIVHKAVINSERGAKAEKDRNAVRALRPYVNPRAIDAIAGTLTKKQLKRFDAFMELLRQART